MAFGLVDGPGTLGGIHNPIVEIFESDGVLNFRLLRNENDQIWIYDQSKDTLTTANYGAGITTTIKKAMGITDMPSRASLTVLITKTNITEIAKV